MIKLTEKGDEQMPKKKEEISIEEYFRDIEKILHEFENGDIALENSIKMYSEAVNKYNEAKKILEKAKVRIKEISGELEGKQIEFESDKGKESDSKD